MKRSSANTKENDLGGPQLIQYRQAGGSGPDRWRRRKEVSRATSEFLFHRRRELSLCLICLSMVLLIIGTLLRNSGSQAEKDSNGLRTSSSIDKKTTPVANLKRSDQRLRENPKAVDNERKDRPKSVNDKGAAKDNNSNEMLVSKRYVMELAGLVGNELTETHTGTVIIETRPDWAPLGVAHFQELVKEGFYDQCRFFRVVPNFVVQFGIAANPSVQQKWREKIRHEKLMDDPVERSNQRGTITYATSGKNTRNTQLFINKRDNAYLDKEGFAPFAQVLKGMEYVDKINAQYKEKPNQSKIQKRGNEYLMEEFPDLSYIVSLREEDQDMIESQI